MSCFILMLSCLSSVLQKVASHGLLQFSLHPVLVKMRSANVLIRIYKGSSNGGIVIATCYILDIITHFMFELIVYRLIN